MQFSKKYLSTNTNVRFFFHYQNCISSSFLFFFRFWKRLTYLNSIFSNFFWVLWITRIISIKRKKKGGEWSYFVFLWFFFLLGKKPWNYNFLSNRFKFENNVYFMIILTYTRTFIPISRSVIASDVASRKFNKTREKTLVITVSLTRPKSIFKTFCETWKINGSNTILQKVQCL